MNIDVSEKAMCTVNGYISGGIFTFQDLTMRQKGENLKEVGHEMIRVFLC